MLLLNLDELAVHTVAAAAFRILRDVKEKRGRSELSDSLNRGMFFVARDLANGKLKELPSLLEEPILSEIHALAGAIKEGKVRAASDVIFFQADPARERLTGRLSMHRPTSSNTLIQTTMPAWT